MTRSLKTLALGLWLPVLIVTFWWFATKNAGTLFFPPLSLILDHFFSWWIGPGFIVDVVPSMVNLAAGYVIALLLGIGGGLLIGSATRLREATSPVLEYARAVPAVALLPAAVIILGLGDTMRIGLIAAGSVWPILLSTIAGVRETMTRLTDVEEAFRLPLRIRLLVRLQGALPRLLAGARTAIAIAIVLIVVSEMQGGAYGIGNRLLIAQRNFAIAEMWSAMLLLGFIGYILNMSFLFVQAVALRHHLEGGGVDRQRA